MKCAEVAILLTDAIEGRLPQDVQQAVDHHLSICADCCNEKKDLEALFAIIDHTPLKEPGETLRSGFNAMLSRVMEEQKKSDLHRKIRMPSWSQIAAGLLLLATGLATGLLINIQPSKAPEEMAQLRKEVRSAKEDLVYSLVNEESVFQRIKAVNYADQIQQPDAKLLEALTAIMQQDPNTNVRLAATNSLGRFTDDAAVRDAMLTQLNVEQAPILQITLIRILTDCRETRAIQPIETIAKDNASNKEARIIAVQSLKRLKT